MKKNTGKPETIIRRGLDGLEAESNITGDILQFRRNGWRLVFENKHGVKFVAPNDTVIIGKAARYD